MPPRDLMTIIWQSIKTNPIKTITGLITIFTTVISSLMWIDSRYVHADFISEYKQEQTQFRNDITNSSELSRVRDYEDDLEEIELKDQLGKSTELDRAKKPKLERKIRDLKISIINRGGRVD